MSASAPRSGASLVIDVVELRRHTGARRSLRTEVRLDEATVGEFAVVDGALELDLVVEAVAEGVVVAGRVTGTWRGPCRRCLDEIEAPLEVELREVFETRPTEGETWPIDDERIDLEPMLREAALLALPLAPLCRDDCAGPEPERFPARVTAAGVDDADADGDGEAPGRDPRWAALDELRFDESDR